MKLNIFELSVLLFSRMLIQGKKKKDYLFSFISLKTTINIIYELKQLQNKRGEEAKLSDAYFMILSLL